MVDQADQALLLWQQLGIKSAHLVAHDMGDSVLTEILARRQNKILPDHFDGFFKVNRMILMRLFLYFS